MDTEQLLYNEDTERLVIGTLIASRDAYPQVKELLNEDCFTVSQYKRLFRCVRELSEKDMQVDMFTVMAQAKRDGWQISHVDMIRITDYRTFSIEVHAAELHDLWVRRSLILMADTLKERICDLSADPFTLLTDWGKQTERFYRTDEKGVSEFVDVLRGLRDIVNANSAGDKAVTGTPTGFGQLDMATSGLHGSDLTVIAAESGQGKTSMALNIAVNAAMNGDKIAIYSMEMPKEQLAARIVSPMSGVSASRILYKPLSTEERESFDNALGKASNAAIYFDDRSTSDISGIISSIRYLHTKYGINGAMIDYLQLLSINSRSYEREEQALGEYARRLKNIAKELGIWIVALSQLSRDKSNPAPNVNRLRGSGQIHEAADNVILIYRPDAYNITMLPAPFDRYNSAGRAVITISKGRNVGQHAFMVGFDAAHTRFYDLNEEEAPPPPADPAPPEIRRQIERDNDLPF